jgi:hypothetical protein
METSALISSQELKRVNTRTTREKPEMTMNMRDAKKSSHSLLRSINQMISKQKSNRFPRSRVLIRLSKECIELDKFNLKRSS